MGRIVYGIIAVIASFILVESLKCNKCTVGLLGVCMNSAEENCTSNSSVCFTGRATFPSLTSFVGFNTQGCSEPAGCNATTNATLLGATYVTAVTCCSTDLCNPVQISGAPSTKLSLTAAVGAAILASAWGSMLY